MALWLLRVFFAALCTVSVAFLRPFALEARSALVLGLACSLVAVALEAWIRRFPLSLLAGAAAGIVSGLGAALLAELALARLGLPDPATTRFLQLLALLWLPYLGLAAGTSRGVGLPLGRAAGGATLPRGKILDTSVIIDGRVGDILEAGFLEGPLIVPRFVLAELQQVADSADSGKRNRGRRGLDILRRIQQEGGVAVEILDRDFPQIPDVDTKLIELAREMHLPIVTNDFNLNKVARLRGVAVLNINRLANCLKPVVLPGETLSVPILKEGKEPNQGVAYLDDGTMVVVDNARQMIGKTIEITVTSVLQTTAGKMIFGRFMGTEAPREVGRQQVRSV